jgi:histidinol-phosphate/aromatic aminotransferase/cobyric acid decarboxylase-like protein
MERNVATMIETRDELDSRLQGLGLRVLPSQTNFLLCEVGGNAHEVARELMAVGLVARKFPADGPLRDYLRFTVRTPEAHERLIGELERCLR